MTAKILTVANQKGGSGKTNLAMTLGGVLGGRGFKVVVVDGDVQGTATHWYSCAPDDKPFPAVVTNLAAAGRNFARPVKELLGTYDIIVIDTPPLLDSPVLLQSLGIADVCFVPMKPATGDLWATAPLMKVLEMVAANNPSIKVRVIANEVQATSNAADSLDALAQIVVGAVGNSELDMAIGKSSFSSRVAFRDAIGIGGTVLDLKDAKAIQEANGLADEALELLGLPVKLTAST